MTSLTVDKLHMRVAAIGENSSVPPIFKTVNVQQRSKSKLDEEDGLYLGYGFVDDVFPYRKQDLYSMESEEKEVPAVVLENDCLKAVFLPSMGARLWRLFDKKAKRDLLLTGDEIAFGNLAVRDAWFCGGVEWNFGVIGHSPFTCEPVYTAMLETEDGTPVVRFYEYERIRGCTYQVDCWLPEKSNRLYVGVRIVNPNTEVVPTYWWSNIAVEENAKARVIVPTNEAYVWSEGAICKKNFVRDQEHDVTYPTNILRAADHFWRTKDARNKFIAYVDEQGYGLCQASSSMQKGRKLFVWGQSNGADNWQCLLKTNSKNGHYIELQAGLGQTQYECIPMPPNTAWSWVECYGPIQIDPSKAHGKYSDAICCVDEAVARYEMEQIWRGATHLKLPAQKILFEGSGWGTLEQLYREGRDIRPLSYNLTFTKLDKAQLQWKLLLETGSLGEHDPQDIPVSWMHHKGFTALLEKAVQSKDKNNWYTHLHLGTVQCVEGKFTEAEKTLRRSIELRQNAWAHYVLACLYWKIESTEKAVEEAIQCLRIKNNDVSLARAVTAILNAANRHQVLIAEIEALPEQVKQDNALALSLACAYLATGEIEKAERIAGNDPGKFAVYVREGSIGPTNYWLEIQKAKREKSGLSSCDLIDHIPMEWDFRMG